MTTISVRGYRGIAAADISCAPIALICGANGSGKSSIAQAVAACLTGTAISSRFGLTKGEAGQLVRRGAKSGTARLQSEGGEARMSWPDCEHSTTGAAPPHASVFAAGLLSVATLPEKERAKALEPYLKATPTLDDLKLAMEDRFSLRSIEAIWDELQKKGWDQAAAGYEVTRRDAGRDWGKTAGENFGSDKARNWRPTGWDELFDPLTAEDMETQVNEARAELEGAIAGQAVDEAELAGLRDIAGKLEERQAFLVTAKASSEVATKAWFEANAARNKLAEPVQGAGTPCPHCGEPVAIKREGAATTLEKFAKISEAENKKRRDAVAAADGDISRLKADEGLASRGLALAESNVAISEGARDKISGMGEKKGNAGLVTRAREVLLDCQLKLAMRKKVDAATALYRDWTRSDLLLKILAPSGLRAKKLGEAVGTFNETILAPLCDVAGWAPVNLTETLDVRLGERPYALCSDGEQFRARATLAIAQARLDGSTMVILDGADILDTPGRNGLFRLLADTELPALIAMTTVRGATVPDLAAAGLGATWTLDAATAKPLGASATGGVT